MASIVMLAFVVFPHHHHNEYICFATAHCQDEGENEEHSHDTGSSNHRCVKNLFQYVEHYLTRIHQKFK